MFTKPNAIVYVRRTGLIVAGRRIAPARLTFPADVLANMEVLAPDKFTGGCQQFFKSHGVHGKRALVVLDGSIVFDKNIGLDKSGKPDALADAFLAAMPFEPGKRALLTLRQSDALQLYATNAELYQCLVQALRGAGAAKVTAVTPAPAYDLGQDKPQLAAAIGQFINDTSVRAQADFLGTTPA